MSVKNFYPSVDLQMRYDTGAGAGVAWATLRGYATANGIVTTVSQVGNLSDTVSGKYRVIRRYALIFDTSSIPEDAVIKSATLRMAGNTKSNNDTNFKIWLALYTHNSINDGSLVAGDFDVTRFIEKASSNNIHYDSFPTGGTYYYLTLNGVGIAAINKDGNTHLGLADELHDIGNSAPTWASAKSCLCQSFCLADIDARKPMLSIEYTTGDEMFTKDFDNNPLFNPASGGARWPAAVYHDGIYHLFLGGPAESPSNISHWTSDDGINFTNQGDVINKGASGQWDDKIAEPHTCIWWAPLSEWRIYYGGYKNSDSTWRFGYAYASSLDGTWTKYAGNPCVVPSGTEGHCADPTGRIFSGPYGDGKLYLYYQNWTGTAWQTCLCWSTDGRTFTKYGGNPLSGGIFGSHANWILSDGSVFHVGGGGGDLSASHSVDWINTTEYDNNPVLQRGVAGGWEAGYITHCDIVQVGGQLILYYCACDVNTTGAWQIGRAFINVTPFGNLQVTTQEVTDIGWGTATGNGTITSLGSDPLTKRGFCYNKTGNPTIADPHVEETGEGFGTGVFDLPITGLDSETHYYLRAYAYDGSYVYGNEEEFDTVAKIVVETHFPLNVRATAVTGNGYCSDMTSIEMIGFEWGIEDGVYGDEVTEAGTFESGSFYLEMEDLTFSTLYYYRAKVYHSALGWLYGNEIFFYTKPPVPVVRTDPPSDAQIDHIDAVGNITSVGAAANCDRRGFVYGLTSFPADPETPPVIVVGHLPVEPGGTGFLHGYTFLSTYSPANLAGTIRVIKLRAFAGGGTWHVGIFYWTGSNYKCRSVAPLGPIVTGYNEIVGLNLAIEAGDCIGYYATSGLLDGQTFAGGYAQWVTGNYCTVGAEFDSSTPQNYRLSIRGESGEPTPPPESTSYDDSVEEEDAFGVGSFELKLANLNPSRVYYYRAWAHSSYGYGYGAELKALSSYTVNILYPNGVGDTGIRFDTSPGGGYPHPYMGSIPHYRLVLSEDSAFVSGGVWGYLLGNFIYEANYYNDNFYRDLYLLSDPIRRTEGILKIKWKAKVGRNAYPYGHFKWSARTEGVAYDGPTIDAYYGGPWPYCWIFYLNHNTGMAWTLAQADAYQAGITLGQGGSLGAPFCDYIEARVLWANATVTTKPPESLSDISVRLKGHIDEDEAEACVVYFEYGTTVAYGSVTPDQTDKHILMDFTADITVVKDTTYHCRAVIETACGETFYGSDFEFIGGNSGLIIEMAFGQSIFTVNPVWTDVTKYVKSLHTKRGRMHELGKIEAGTAVFVLDNADGNWWRNNTIGDYYPNVRPMTLIRARYSFDGIHSIYYGYVESIDPGWESDRGGFNPLMVIGAVDVFKCFTRYKIVDANPALIADVASGQVSVIIADAYGLVVGQAIKIYDENNSEVNYISSIDDSDPAVTIVNMQYDLSYSYSINRGAKLKKFPSILSGRRIADIILEVGWPLDLVAIDDGQVQLIEISPPTGGTNAMEALYDAVESEDGNLFVAANGIVTFHDSIARTKSPYNTSQATFRDNDTSSKYISPMLKDDDSFIYNEVDISGESIEQQIMIDATAQSMQGPRALTRTKSLIANDYDANSQAFVLVQRFKDSSLRPQSLLIMPAADELDLIPKAMGYDLVTRITLLLNSATNPAQINQAYHIEGIEQNWNPRKGWQTEWQLWETNKYRTFKVTHDGYLLNISETSYLDCHDADDASHAPYNDDPSGIEVGQWTVYVGGYFSSARIERGYFEVNTSTILNEYSILEAYLLIRVEEMYLSNNWNLVIVDNGGVDSPLATSDYGILGNMMATRGTEGMQAPVGWKVIELNALGIASIVKEGTTRFALRSNRDISSIDPGEISKEYINIAGLNSFGGKYLPRLVVRLA